MFKSTDEMSAYELLRLKNMEENRQKMMELGLISEPKSNHDGDKPARKNYSKKLFKNVTGQNRTYETRRSKKLSLENTFDCLSDEFSVIFGDERASYIVSKDEYSINDVLNNISQNKNDNEVIYRKRKSIKTRDSISSPRVIPSAEEITDEDLDKIAKSSSNKVYCQTDGTTCHQCRQKTTDQKTICRNPNCFGVRGQFCGPCLTNRYGESARDALKDPEWSCPPCRRICNCSICRNNAGKIPTGQMAPWAFENGFKSVKECLEAEGED